MIRFFRRRKPAPSTQPLSLADIAVAHAWGLSLTDWAALTDFERAEARRTITTAPQFQEAS